MMFPTIAIVLHSRALKDGSHPVYLRATFRGKNKFFPIDLHSKDSEWDKKAGRFLKHAEGAKEKNEIIKAIEVKAEAALYALKREGAPFSFERFSEAVFSPVTPILFRSVHSYAVERSKALSAEGMAGNAAIYETLSKVVFAFKKDLVFSEINPALLAKFERFLRRDRGNSDGGVSVTFRTLRALCNHAAKHGNAPAEWQPFAGFKIKKGETEAGGRALSIEDFRKIEAAEVPPGSAAETAKDLFVLSFYLRGANLADILRLSPKSIVADRVEFIRHKTRNTKPRRYSLPLTPEVRAIFAKYARQNMRWLLPALDGIAASDEAKIKARVHSYTKLVNFEIRAIAAGVGVETSNLRYYSARHTAATALAKAGVDIRIIQDFLGHEDFKTTQLYLKKHSPAEIDEAADILRSI